MSIMTIFERAGLHRHVHFERRFIEFASAGTGEDLASVSVCRLHLPNFVPSH
jgi:hypothetical protein